MKWLSPPDKSSVRVVLHVDSRDILSAKLVKLVKERFGFTTMDFAPGSIKIYVRFLLRNYVDALSRVKLLLRELTGMSVNVCIDYWVKAWSTSCSCSKPFKHGGRVLCFENIDDLDTLVYCYSDLNRRVSILRFPRFKPLGAVDPFLVTKHLFIECGEPLHIADYIDKAVIKKLELLV